MIFYIVFFFFIAFFQSFFSLAFFNIFIFPDIILPIVFLIFLKETSFKKIFLVSFVGGFFEDLYSLRPLGISILIFLCIFFIWKNLERFTAKSNVLWIPLFFFLFYLSYLFLFYFLSFSFSFRFYFPTNFLKVNFLLVEFLVFLILYPIFSKIKYSKVI